ncbi:MAG: NAD-dependent epimerase/dehydratase family protein [Phycisphaerae bacterium]|nr:NAD-dependent epimerase/dehydratase family protein [Phycisphaerae bacterium]
MAHTPASPGSTPARRVLVSGGSGFIGSHLVERLLARGDEVTVVDDLSTGRKRNMPAPSARLRFIEADLHDALQALGKGEVFDQVYHLAAAVGVRLVMDDPIRTIQTNIDQTLAILRFAQGRSPAGGGALTFIASSSEVYGKSDKTPFSEEDDVVYGPTTVTRWSYACTKAIDEYLALAFHRQKSVPTVVVRFFNTVGPRQVGDYGMVLPRFVGAALAGADLEVHGDGEQTRCFCDVRDVADALPRLMESRECWGRVFNVGSDKPISMLDLARRVIDVLGSRSRVAMVPYTDAFPGGFEDLRQRRPDLTRVRRAIGFEPRVALEQTIRDLASWMKDSGSADRGPEARG